MRTLPSAIINLKNQLAVSGAWLTLMGIYYPDNYAPSASYFYVNDNSGFLFGTLYYSASSFQVQQITEEVQMSLPKISVIIYQPQLNLRTALQTHDGMSGGTVVLRRVYKSIAGVVTDLGIRQEFIILDVNMADTVITLSLGIADPLARRFPRDNYGALTCRHKYKGGFCRYTASQTPDDGNLLTCTHTLEDAPDGTKGCRSHNNSNQFGGSPGAAEGIFYDRR